MSTEESQVENGSKKGVLPWPRRTYARLTSLSFAVTVLILIAVACVIGTLLPQEGQVDKLLEAKPHLEKLMRILGEIGLTHVFTSWWFMVLLFLLAASLAACSLRRAKAIHDKTGHLRIHVIGSVLTHVSMLFILAGGVIRGVWGIDGMLGLTVGETRSSFVLEGTNKEAPLPFSVHLVDFKVETYERESADPDQDAFPGEHLVISSVSRGMEETVPLVLSTPVDVGPAESTNVPLRVRIMRRVPDFVIDMETREIDSRSDQPNNPAILVETVEGTVTNNQWLFALHPGFNMHADGHGTEAHGEEPVPDDLKMLYHFDRRAMRPAQVKDWKSTLQVIVDDKVVKEKTIEVNSPLSYAGYTFYQASTSPNDPTWTGLQVVRDPGVPLVYIGFVLIIVGMTILFCIPRTRSAGSAAQGTDQ